MHKLVGEYMQMKTQMSFISYNHKIPAITSSNPNDILSNETRRKDYLHYSDLYAHMGKIYEQIMHEHGVFCYMYFQS